MVEECLMFNKNIKCSYNLITFRYEILFHLFNNRANIDTLNWINNFGEKGLLFRIFTQSN